jgi:hypothetical protein
LQIADLQVNRADVSLLGQTRRRRNTIGLRNVSALRNHHVTFERMSGPYRFDVECHADVVAD